MDDEAAKEGFAIRSARSYRVRTPTRRSKSRGHGKRNLPTDVGMKLSIRAAKERRKSYIDNQLMANDELNEAIRRLLKC